MNQSARRALLEHYDRAKRDLPWRGERDPYRVLVSEVMLQQTRVDTVTRYYEPWLERFPTSAALAEADTDEVLKAWEGLGYYRRARNLHAAAKVVCEREDGALPGDYHALRDLPGVGDYTAGAVASIAFDEAVPAVDGNVKRVLSRWYDEPTPTPAWLRQRAAELVDAERPGDWNQALMELGATVCTPRGPACDRCPVAEWCAARAAGTQEELPAAKRRAQPREADFVVAVMACDGLVLLTRRPEGGLLGGMWAFPEVEVSRAAPRVVGELPGDRGEEPRDSAVVAAELARSLGASPTGATSRLPPVQHAFTHLRARYLPVVMRVSGAPAGADRAWVHPSDTSDFALPVAQRKIMESAAREIA